MIRIDHALVAKGQMNPPNVQVPTLMIFEIMKVSLHNRAIQVRSGKGLMADGQSRILKHDSATGRSDYRLS